MNLNSFLFLAFWIFPLSAHSICNSKLGNVKITTTIDYGIAKYESVNPAQIQKLENIKNPFSTMGVSIADLEILFNVGTSMIDTHSGICTTIDSIDFKIGFKDLTILIDEKYPKQSCEYKAILKHELQHIKVFTSELKYYGDLIINELNILAHNIDPILTNDIPNKAFIAKKINNLINENKKINILQKRFTSTIKERNNLIDSLSEYKKVNKTCTGW